jgi:hypothetical protein
MKLRSDLNLYVIGMRRCAEVRVGKKPPIPHTTSFEKVVPVTKLIRHTDDVWGNPRFTRKEVMKKAEFKQTTWEGGRVLGPISANSLAYLGIWVGRDKVREVPAKYVQKLLDHLEAHRD